MTPTDQLTAVRVAAIQAAPVFLDCEATLAKAITLIDKASADGATLIVFPEAFVPAYPEWIWRTAPWESRASDLQLRLFEQSLVVGGPDTQSLAEAARRAGAYVSIGVNERLPQGTTLFSTQLTFGPDGLLVSRHRKLMLTGAERLVWAMGDGSSLAVLDTAFGRVGTLTSWESYMPLARAALYAQGIDLYLAPTWDSSDVWLATLRHVAKEGRVFVIGVNSSMRASDMPEETPHRELYASPEDWLTLGNSAIVGPDGELLAGPLEREEGILFADVDASVARSSRQQFDPIGHYARPDVLRLVVDTTERPAVSFGNPQGP